MQILVVEDERRMADLLKRGLSEEGHQVIVARDGAAGRVPVRMARFRAAAAAEAAALCGSVSVAVRENSMACDPCSTRGWAEIRRRGPSMPCRDASTRSCIAAPPSV